MQELHNALAPAGKSVGVGISPVDTDRPMFWLGNPQFPTAGNIELDWKKWAQDGSVDQLVVWGGSDATVPMNELIAGTRNTSIDLSLMTSSPYDPVWNPYKNQGKILTVGESYESQYLIRSAIPVQPKSSLSSTNQYYRMRTLSQIVEGTMTATTSEILPLLNDSNILNRRLALRALGKIGDSAALTALENALLDADSSVRNAAIYGLVDHNRTASYSAIINAIGQHGEFPLAEGAWAVLRQRTEWIPQLVSTLQTSNNTEVRKLAVRTLAYLGGYLGSGDASPIIAAAHDADPSIRAYAIDALGQLYGSAQGVQTLVDAMQSSDTIVASRAATALSQSIQYQNPAALARKQELIGLLANQFASLGDGTLRADKNWAYQPIGNALVDLGAEGKTILNGFMNQRVDRRLSELAWQVLYLPQRTHDVTSVTEAEDAYDHFKMPRWDKVVAAADSFDRLTAGSTIDHQIAETGDQWHVLAGTASEQIVQSQFSHGSGKALKLVRHPGGYNAVQLAGYTRNVEAAEITTVTLKGDWMHQHADDSAAFQLNFANANGPAVYIDPAGEYRIWQSDGTATGGIYLNSNVFAGTNDWETIEIVLTFDPAVGAKLTGDYDVFLTRYNGNTLTPSSRTQIADDVGIFSIDERTLMSLVISNQTNGYGDVVTYWDNVSLAVDRVLPSIVGDTDLDGDVDLNDLGALATNYGKTNRASWRSGNFDADMDVDLNDLGALATNYGINSNSSLTFEQAYALTFGAGVPEPTSTATIVAAGTMLFARRVKRRR